MNLSTITPPNTQNDFVLEPTWIHNYEATNVLSGQVLIKVVDAFEFGNSVQLQIQVSGEEPKVLKFNGLVSSEAFTYKNNTYLVNILQVLNNEVKISVVKK